MEEAEISALNTVLGAAPSAKSEPQCSATMPPANHAHQVEVRLCPVEFVLTDTESQNH